MYREKVLHVQNVRRTIIINYTCTEKDLTHIRFDIYVM